MLFPHPVFCSGSGALAGRIIVGGADIVAVEDILESIVVDATAAPTGNRVTGFAFCAALRTGAKASAADHPSDDAMIQYEIKGIVLSNNVNTG